MILGIKCAKTPCDPNDPECCLIAIYVLSFFCCLSTIAVSIVGLAQIEPPSDTDVIPKDYEDFNEKFVSCYDYSVPAFFNLDEADEYDAVLSLLSEAATSARALCFHAATSAPFAWPAYR